MATDSANGNAAPGPASSVPVSNKLQDKMNALREVIDRHKREVLRVSGEMKQLIEDRAQLVIRELEGIWVQANTRMNNKREEVNRKIEEINKRKKKMEELLKDLSPTVSPFGEIDKAINSVRREMDIDIPYVKLSWRASELRESIQGLCTWEQLNVTYREDTNVRVKWGTCGRGKGDKELWNPCGVAIDSMNSRIFVADRGTSRIQIFSINGDWVQSLKDVQMKYPENINLILNSVFVQCDNTIVKFNRISLTREYHKTSAYSLSGICSDNTNVYVGAYSRKELIVLNRVELIEERRIPLTTQYKHRGTLIRDISLAREEFYVLLSGSEYPIQSFSKQGTLNRCIIHRELLSDDVWYFCLDQQLNILVADRGSNKVKFFSKEGKLITQFGKKGSERGEFNGLIGIAVDDSSNIITTDHRYNYRVQTFSPE